MSLELDQLLEPVAPGASPAPTIPLPWSEGWQRLFVQAVRHAWEDLSRRPRTKPCATECSCGDVNSRGRYTRCQRCRVALRPTLAETALRWIAHGCPVEFDNATVSLFEVWGWPVERVYASALEVFQTRPRSAGNGTLTDKETSNAEVRPQEEANDGARAAESGPSPADAVRAVDCQLPSA